MSRVHTKHLVFAVVSMLWTSAALAQPWSFTKIVGSKTVIPGSAEKFDGADSFQYVSVYGDRVAFRGQSKSALHFGVYEWQNGVGRAIADQSTMVPRGTGVFENFRDVNVTSRGSTFFGVGSGNSGLFYDDGTALGHVADRKDDIPDGGGKFTGVTNAHHSVGTSSVFGGFNSSAAQPFGIYRSDDGVLSRIADKTMSPPGHAETFAAFKDWRFDGEATYISAFTADYGGIFRSQGGVLTKVVDSDDVDHDGHHLYTQYVRPAGGNVVFNAFTDNDIEGIYIKTGSGLDKLVDETMAPPDGSSATYGGIGDFDYQAGTLLFQAANGAMYTDYSGSMSRVIGPGDTLDGKRILNLTFYEHGFDGTTAAFWVIFEGDSSFSHDRAIYTVTIPAPGAAGVVMIAAMATSRRRR